MSANVTLWAESEAEALQFLELTKNSLLFNIDEIFIAKRSSGKRDVGAGYIKGEYFKLNLSNGLTSSEITLAPQSVTDVVQWCSQDIILTKDKKPFLVIETTYHILTYNNVAQRLPRQIRSAKVGTPSVIFQKITKNSEILNAWFSETLLRATRIFGTPAMAIMFDEDSFDQSKTTLCHLINGAYKNNSHQIEQEIVDQMQEFASAYDEDRLIGGSRGNGRTWLEINKDEVKVKIGVKDNCALVGLHYGCQGSEKERIEFKKSLSRRGIGQPGCVWLSKGTGGMDPYPGLVKLAEVLLCYDSDGKKIKRLTVEFTKLPQNFWWFEKYPNEIYFRLIKEFADQINYAQSYGS